MVLGAFTGLVALAEVMEHFASFKFTLNGMTTVMNVSAFTILGIGFHFIKIICLS